jgi:hypothetical protein
MCESKTSNIRSRVLTVHRIKYAYPLTKEIFLGGSNSHIEPTHCNIGVKPCLSVGLCGQIFISLWNLFRHPIVLLGRGIGPSQDSYLDSTAQHSMTRKHSHDPSVIRTQDPSIRMLKTDASDQAATGIN